MFVLNAVLAIFLLLCDFIFTLRTVVYASMGRWTCPIVPFRLIDGDLRRLHVLELGLIVSSICLGVFDMRRVYSLIIYCDFLLSCGRGGCWAFSWSRASVGC